MREKEGESRRDKRKKTATISSYLLLPSTKTMNDDDL